MVNASRKLEVNRNMGFGPNLPSRREAVQAILDIVSLLYPERATPSALAVLEGIALVLLQAKAPMSFESIARFLADPAWRSTLLETAATSEELWQRYTGLAIDPNDLDVDFAWLVNDRLKALADDSEA